MKQRAKKVIIITAVIIVIGCVYAVFFKTTGIGIPCAFRLVTGLECPGCGMTRMCTSLLMLDFKAAWSYNPVIMCLLPVGAFLFYRGLKRYIVTGRNSTPKWEDGIITAMTVILLVFGVVRNIV